MGFPGGTVVKIMPTSAGNARDLGLIPGSGRSLEYNMATTPVLLPGKFHGQRSLVGCSPWGHKEQHSMEHAAGTHTLTIENLEHCRDG